MNSFPPFHLTRPIILAESEIASTTISQDRGYLKCFKRNQNIHLSHLLHQQFPQLATSSSLEMLHCRSSYDSLQHKWRITCRNVMLEHLAFPGFSFVLSSLGILNYDALNEEDQNNICPLREILGGMIGCKCQCPCY